MEYYLPDRDTESHGLNNKAVINLISKQRAKLIITVDCGISNIEEVKLAKTFNTDIIITDHHEAQKELPDAYAIINPKAENSVKENVSAAEIENLCNLSGAGIVLKLASYILEKLNTDGYFDELISVAAIGTIGDIVPLIGENRHIVYTGLKNIRKKINFGITKLFENAGIKEIEHITSETVAYTAVPRINACGRLGSAETAFKLFISDKEDELEQITQELNKNNSIRQKLCEEAYLRAVEIVNAAPDLYKNAIVICDENAHIGIIGLSASKLVEKYNKPAFVMQKNGQIYRCSCRGLKGINIFEILNANRDLFLGFGGHEFAGGFSFDGNKYSVEQIQKAINETIIEQTNGVMPDNILNIDVYCEAGDITIDLAETVRMLEPFGALNPPPVFAMKNLKISDYKFMGKNQNHLKLYCSAKDGQVFECIKWSDINLNADKGNLINIAFTPEINNFNGKKTIQLILTDMQFPEDTFPLKIIDCRNQKGCYEKITEFLNHTKKKVGIFTENQDIIKYFSEFDNAKMEIFERDNIPKDIDMCICIDSPPSYEFLNKIIENDIKEILFMHYDTVSEDNIQILSRIAGMMKYTHTSLGGKTSVKAMRKALLIDDKVTYKALSVLRQAKIINAKIDEKGNISVEKVQPSCLSTVKETKEYEEYNESYNEYKNFREMIMNLPCEEIKRRLCRNNKG